MKRILILTFLVFLGSLHFSTLAQQDDLEQSLNESLTGLNKLSKDMDPAESSVSSEAGAVLPKDTSLLDRMILKIKKKFEDEMKANPFRRMSGAEVEKLISDKTQGTFIGNFLKESPRVMYFIVNFVRDEFAMSDMFEIFKKEKDLRTYSYFVIGNLIFFFLLGLYYDKKSRSGFIRTIFRKIFLIILSSAISLAVFYVLFHKELKPTIGIAKEAMTKEFKDNKDKSLPANASK